jgi:hypothetical protein
VSSWSSTRAGDVSQRTIHMCKVEALYCGSEHCSPPCGVSMWVMFCTIPALLSHASQIRTAKRMRERGLQLLYYIFRQNFYLNNAGLAKQAQCRQSSNLRFSPPSYVPVRARHHAARAITLTTQVSHYHSVKIAK